MITYSVALNYTFLFIFPYYHIEGAPHRKGSLSEIVIHEWIIIVHFLIFTGILILTCITLHLSIRIGILIWFRRWFWCFYLRVTYSIIETYVLRWILLRILATIIIPFDQFVCHLILLCTNHGARPIAIIDVHLGGCQLLFQDFLT